MRKTCLWLRLFSSNVVWGILMGIGLSFFGIFIGIFLAVDETNHTMRRLTSDN